MTLTWQVWHPDSLFPFLFAVEVFSIKNAKSLCAFFVSVCSVQHTGQRGPLRRIEVRLALMIPYFMKSKNRKVDIKTLCLQLLFVHVINLLFKVGNFFSSFFLVPPPPPFFFFELWGGRLFRAVGIDVIFITQKAQSNRTNGNVFPYKVLTPLVCLLHYRKHYWGFDLRYLLKGTREWAS